MSNTLTITAELAHKIIREKYNLPDDFGIVISDVVESNSDRIAVTSEWIEVPDNWRNEFAPPETKRFDFIEVMYRDGSRDFDRPDAWTISWNSNVGLAQIIKFRPASK